MDNYMEAVKEQKLQRCPHIIRKLAGDETCELCELSDRPSGMKSCLIEHGGQCDIWDEIQKEWIKESETPPYPGYRIVKEIK